MAKDRWNSIASILGPAGQTNKRCSNCFLLNKRAYKRRLSSLRVYDGHDVDPGD
jgi:hypothetical protein